MFVPGACNISTLNGEQELSLLLNLGYISHEAFFLFSDYIFLFMENMPPKNMTKKSVVNNDTQKSYCSSQPSMVNWLSSSIFSSSVGRSFVPPAMVTSDKISNLFNINWHKSHIITQYHLIPSSTKLC